MSYFDARFTCLQPTHTSISVLHNFTSSYLCSLSLPPTSSLPVVGKHLISSGLAPVLGPEKYPYLCENRKQIRSAPGHQGTRTYLTRQREQNPIQKLAPTQPHQMTLCIFSTICIKHCTSPHRSILVSSRRGWANRLPSWVRSLSWDYHTVRRCTGYHTVRQRTAYTGQCGLLGGLYSMCTGPGALAAFLLARCWNKK